MNTTALIVIAASPAFLQHERADHFDAPKARLFELIVRGIFGDFFRESPVLAWLVVVLLAMLVFGIPAFLAWDFARGTGRRTWPWVVLALVSSWLVLPVMWVASSRQGGDASNSTEPGP